MRGLTGGTPRDDPSLRREIGALRKAIDLLDQRMQRMQKIPTPGVGGFLGSAQLTSTSGSVVQGSSGARIAEGDVTYSAPVDPHAGTGGEGLAPSGWCTVSGFQITLEEGWYTATVVVDAAWETVANAPEFAGVYIAGVPNEIGEYIYFPTVDNQGFRKGVRAQLQTGPFYAGFGPLWVEVEFGTHTGTSDPLVGLSGSADASHVWTIVKHT